MRSLKALSSVVRIKCPAPIVNRINWSVSCRLAVLRAVEVLHPLLGHPDVLPAPVPIVAAAIENRVLAICQHLNCTLTLHKQTGEDIQE